jgi:hypothetical protein
MDSVKFALHRKDRFVATKAMPSLCDNPSTPTEEPNYSPNYTDLGCNEYVVTGPLGASTVYLVIANAGEEGISAASFGIDYSGRPNQMSGIDPQYVSFTPCADGLIFPNSGPNGEFPNPGGGVRLTWNVGAGGCANEVIGSYGVHAVVGSFYVYAYAPGDVMKVIPNNNLQRGPELAVADCAGRETDLIALYPDDHLEDILAKVGFGSELSSGFNPCGGLPLAIGQWGFDEAASGPGEGIAYDAAPKTPHHGTIVGASYIPGIVGHGALHFDGTGDFVGILGAGSKLELVDTGYTISWWANPDDFNGVQTILEMDDGQDHSGGYSVFLDGQYLKLAHENGQDNTAAFTALDLCGWRHFAVTYSKGLAQRTLYVNGVLVQTLPVSGGALTTDGNDQLFFGAHGGGSHFFRGGLDDVRIYDGALSAGQVALLFKGVPNERSGVLEATARNNSNQVKVTFKMPVGQEASNPANYSVFPTLQSNNIIPVTGVTLQGATATLSLATSLAMPTAYSINVSNVENLCGVPIAPSLPISLQLIETDPPRLLFVSGFAGMDTVRVIFSEPVGIGSDVTANYSVYLRGQPGNQIPVQTATAQGTNVLLQLAAPLNGNSSYTLEVTNVQDGNGNTILPGSQLRIVPATPLMGEFASDFKLTKAKPGPSYQLLGDLRIAHGATLTVEPGVHVTFTANQDAANVGDFLSQAEVLCDGNIIANGTSQDSIFFESDGTSPGDWGQIKLSATGQAVLAYCALKRSQSAIVALPGSKVTLSHSSILDSNLDAMVNAGDLTLSDCRIERAGARGVFASEGRLSMVRTFVNQTAMEAIRQEGGAGELNFLNIDAIGGYGAVGPKFDGIFSSNSTTAIRWNTLSHCGKDGIFISGGAPRGIVTGNKVNNVGGAGIHLLNTAQDSIQFCDIFDCAGSGIFLENPGSSEFVGNCLVGRSQDGIKSIGGTDLAVHYSTITNCRGNGLYQGSSSGVPLSVQNSIVVSNAGWGIRDLSSATDDDIRFVDSWNNALGQYSGTVCDSVCLSSNPLFANPALNDYRLTSNSALRFLGENMTQVGRYGPDLNDVVGVDEGDITKLRFPLSNYPNPFARSTTIAFSSESARDGNIEVYSVTGRLIRRDAIRVSSGINQIAFKRGDMASGLYFYRVSWPGHHLTAKMILLP